MGRVWRPAPFRLRQCRPVFRRFVVVVHCRTYPARHRCGSVSRQADRRLRRGGGGNPPRLGAAARWRRLVHSLWNQHSDRHRLHDEPLHRHARLRRIRCRSPHAPWRARGFRAFGDRRGGSAGAGVAPAQGKIKGAASAIPQARPIHQPASRAFTLPNPVIARTKRSHRCSRCFLQPNNSHSTNCRIGNTRASAAPVIATLGIQAKRLSGPSKANVVTCSTCFIRCGSGSALPSASRNYWRSPRHRYWRDNRSCSANNSRTIGNRRR